MIDLVAVADAALLDDALLRGERGVSEAYDQG